MCELARRDQLRFNTEVEKLLLETVFAISQMPAEPRTLQAVLLVQSARNIIGDIEDENLKNNAGT